MRFVSVFALSLSLALSAAALEPKDVFVVVNKNVPASRQVADHYLKARGVPKENVVELDLPATEDITRADYEAKLAGPLRKALEGRKAAVKVLLTVYGVPLRALGPVQTPDEKAALGKLQPEYDAAKKKLDDLRAGKADPKEIAAAAEAFTKVQERQFRLTHQESSACVDSELMLLWWPAFDTTRFVWNPLYWQASEKYRAASPPVLLTARLDGPTPEIARRLVDDAVATEAKGLGGAVVVDARGIKYNPADPAENGGYGYGAYDESMRETARLLEAGGMKVLLDDKPELLPAKSHKGVGIYCGWYSLGNFVDCCEFEKGAVAWHLASSEAITLRNVASRAWCPNLLDKGVAATLGPVNEPYAVGFPKPEEFFGFLATGEFTLAECFARTTVFTSWQMVLVGDPLYNPFKKTPKVKAADVRPSPKGVKVISP